MSNHAASSLDTPQIKGENTHPPGGLDASDRTSQPVLPLCPTPPPVLDDVEPIEKPQIDTERGDESIGFDWLPELRSVVSFLVSFFVHAALIVTLALISLVTPPRDDGLVVLTASTRGFDSSESDVELPAGSLMLPMPEAHADQPSETSIRVEMLRVDPTLVEPRPISSTRRHGIGLAMSHSGDLALPTGSVVGGGLEGRNRDYRRGLLSDGIDDGSGPSGASEDAVERALRWLAAHQRDDGAWDFNHENSICRGMCRNPGSHGSTTAATSVSLLAFLGAGYTHLTGEHQETVRQALYYLGSRALFTPDGVDLQESTMYAQGMAALALCEAYAMTEDPGLKDLAQGSLDFIVFAQDKKGGGWRYTPGQPGDTTVSGWQAMALKSGKLARLNVPSPSLFLIDRYLDGVQSEEGALYGYMTVEPRHTTTAIGLLLRMYRGWRRTRPALVEGVERLGQWGPSDEDAYYNYYATQVMFHWGGADWIHWNVAMRDRLVDTQATDGHESGSWYTPGKHCDVGGRVLSTALSAMTLEVYYRYMPLYDTGWLDMEE